ncbi:MAG TPA: hypothetical protein VIM30_07175 [Candidatus Limnocylindrales bacterium]
MLAMTAALAMAIPATASADSSAACFGGFVASSAHDPPHGASSLGEFISGIVQVFHPYGQVGIPFFKALACE